ncbi:MAG: FliG C-terminal domain-containing protein, partial [Bacillota bacterium]
RIAVMERTSPQILKGVENVMRERLATIFQQDFTMAGGIPTVVDILNQVDRGTEKVILEELEKEDAELAELIRQQMFIFEDIVNLDDSSIQRVVREIDNNDIALALKGASDEVKNRIFKNISKRGGEILRENMEYMGPVRLRDVEEAQQKVVMIIRRLDESGEIIISRGGEDAIIA